MLIWLNWADLAASRGPLAKSPLRLDSTFDFSPDKKFAPPKPFNYNQPSAYGLTRKLFQWLLDTV